MIFKKLRIICIKYSLKRIRNFPTLELFFVFVDFSLSCFFEPRSSTVSTDVVQSKTDFVFVKMNIFNHGALRFGDDVSRSSLDPSQNAYFEHSKAAIVYCRTDNRENIQFA